MEVLLVLVQGLYFYSRPCGRGDDGGGLLYLCEAISTHAPAGGATSPLENSSQARIAFLLTPLREGRLQYKDRYPEQSLYFYSRPCGRGDFESAITGVAKTTISTHAPAGGATVALSANALREVFLLTPLREGRHKLAAVFLFQPDFYSRPCGRGDGLGQHFDSVGIDFYSRPCGRGDARAARA